MIETGAYWVGKSNGNHGNCTGVLCRCSVCGHEHTFFAYSLEPCANCGRTMMGMKNVPFKRELIVPRDVSPEALNLAEQGADDGSGTAERAFLEDVNTETSWR